VIDVGKFGASKNSLNFISVPTSPSHDGIASPVAIIVEDGKSRSLASKIPSGVIADIDVIKKAPIRNIRAGLCDLLSNITAVKDWKLAYRLGKDRFDDFSAALSLASADWILTSGKDDFLSDLFFEKLLNGLVLSGISMAIAGSSRPCSGAEHEFSHALDYLFPGRALHGEQVGLGILVSSYLFGLDTEALRSYCNSVGVPTHYRDLGFSREDVVKALVFAPNTRPDRYTIIEHKDIDEGKADGVIAAVFDSGKSG
jgi:glycerol-1-phosphate dehydrogenase [NAD(P)+]